MFSLIITIISIALVAALALATLYYGGAAFNEGMARATYAKVQAQGQQIQGASELYKADRGVYPDNVQQLVDGAYLKEVPVAQADSALVASALAASTWEVLAARIPVFVLYPVDVETCKAINQGSFGLDGILKNPRSFNRIQCVGTDLGELKVLQAKSGDALVQASESPVRIVDIGTVLESPIPAADSTDSSDAGWLLPPGAPLLEQAPEEVAAGAIEYYSLGDDKIFSYSFGQVEIDYEGYTEVYVYNASAYPIQWVDDGFSVGAPFGVDYSSCTGELLPEEGCFVALFFAPPQAQTFSGSAYLLQPSAQNVALPALELSGEGVQPPFLRPYGEEWLVVVPDSYNAVTLLSGSAASMGVTLYNNSPVDISWDNSAAYVSMHWPGSIPVQESISVTGCSYLAAGESCRVTMTVSSPWSSELVPDVGVVGILNFDLPWGDRGWWAETGEFVAEKSQISVGFSVVGLTAVQAPIFPNTAVGSSAEGVFTIANNGATTTPTLTFGTLAQGGTAADEFSIVSTTCGALGVGQSCQVVVRFSPKTAGSHAGYLTYSTTGRTSFDYSEGQRWRLESLHGRGI